MERRAGSAAFLIVRNLSTLFSQLESPKFPLVETFQRSNSKQQLIQNLGKWKIGL